MQIPVTAVETVIHRSIQEKELKLDYTDQNTLELNQHMFIIKLRDEFLPVYFTPNYTNMGLNCDVSELQMTETTRDLIKDYQVL